MQVGHPVYIETEECQVSEHKRGENARLVNTREENARLVNTREKRMPG